jgi:hypothetical protein
MSYNKEKQQLLRAQLRLEWGATVVVFMRACPIIACVGAVWAWKAGYIPW